MLPQVIVTVQFDVVVGDIAAPAGGGSISVIDGDANYNFIFSQNFRGVFFINVHAHAVPAYRDFADFR